MDVINRTIQDYFTDLLSESSLIQHAKKKNRRLCAMFIFILVFLFEFTNVINYINKLFAKLKVRVEEILLMIQP